MKRPNDVYLESEKLVNHTWYTGSLTSYCVIVGWIFSGRGVHALGLKGVLIWREINFVERVPPRRRRALHCERESKTRRAGQTAMIDDQTQTASASCFCILVALPVRL